MPLAAISLEELFFVVFVILAPLAQRVLGWLQKRRSEAAQRERTRRRREGTLEEEAEPAPKRGFLDWLAEMAGEEEPDAQAAPTRPSSPRAGTASLEPEELADELPEAAPDRAAPGETLWGPLVLEAEREAEEAELVPVAPETAPRAPQPQLTTLVGADGLSTGLTAAPAEGDVESGGSAYRSLSDLHGLDDGFQGAALGSLGEAFDLPDETDTVRAAGSRRLGGDGWARAFVLAEILGPPVALREAHDGAGAPPGLRT